MIVGVVFLFACKQEEKLFVKRVVFPQEATAQQKVDMAARVVPSEKQYIWQQLELTAFIHFGMNTFSGREWGDGREDPALFCPVALDCEQWVRTLKAGGFKMVILTAKHHDGFCLWPTRTTRHSVASSPWKGGKGDVVRELKNACDKYDMKFGIYLSPWDRNAACYGDSPRYNRMFAEQLTELLSHYGTVHEIWFDGANAEGPNGRKQEYDWQLFRAVMDSLQPNAVRAIMGEDIRWVGNENGLGRETEWGVTALIPGAYPDAEENNARLGIREQAKDLGGREIVSKASCLYWYPSEVDVSIRPGWFYHADQDSQVKSLKGLADIYFRSVGYNSVLLLNVPPDKRGLIHENDSIRLKEFGDYLQGLFQDDLLENKVEGFDMQPGASCKFRTAPGKAVNVFLLGEDIRRGQRVEDFMLEARIDGKWRLIAQGTTIGYKRLLRFPPCEASEWRLTVNQSRGTVHFREVGAYRSPEPEEIQPEFRQTDIPVHAWQVVGNKNEVVSYPGTLAIDGDPGTYWQCGFAGSKKFLTVDLGKTYDISGFTYTPVVEEDRSGLVFQYRFYVSTDGRDWTLCKCPGEFGNIMYNPIPQSVIFDEVYTARYFRFEPVREVGNRSRVKVAEIGLLKSK